MFNQSSSLSKWETDIMEKIRSVLGTSQKSLREIFNELDSDGSGTLTANEFRNGIRKLNLGLTSREIDQIMARVDKNGDGKINYQEFASKYQRTNDESQKNQELLK